MKPSLKAKVINLRSSRTSVDGTADEIFEIYNILDISKLVFKDF
jgi:hypothetical protein